MSQLEPRLHGGLITKEKQQNKGTKTMIHQPITTVASKDVTYRITSL